MAQVTILSSDKEIKINEEEFMKWFNDKDIDWWHSWGLSPTGEYEDQDDEGEVRSILPEKIEQFNESGILTNDGDVGWIMASVHIIEEYLKKVHNANGFSFEQYSDDACLIFRKEEEDSE